MFPPLRIATVSPLTATRPSISAATVIAPLGSATSLHRSMRWRMARTMASSSTVTTSSRNASWCAKGTVPIRMDISPSAMLCVDGSVTGSPASRARASFGAPEGSTPITRTAGRSCLTAAATPALNPPPPTGTRTVFTVGMSSTISRPTVPCPAMIRASSKGGTSVPPSDSTSSTARSILSFVVVPASTTRAPSRSAPERFASVTVVGMTTVAPIPNNRAAIATA
jgi:hypothetical protein